MHRLLPLLLTLLASTAHARGTQGHRVVSILGWAPWTAGAHAEVVRLLAVGPGNRVTMAMPEYHSHLFDDEGLAFVRTVGEADIPVALVA